VYLRDPTDSRDPDAVWKISAQAPFGGHTAEGFALGYSKELFLRLYGTFQFTAPDSYILHTSDTHGVALDALFDGAGRAYAIILEQARPVV